MPKTADYQMYCPIARALDVLGDRWTLLIMREMTLGEQRFTDLRAHLPGIPPNLLSQRLKDLIREGLVATRELPPPAARTVYVATEAGMAAVPVLRALTRFGVTRLPPADESTPLRPETVIYAGLKSFYDADAAGDLDEHYAVEIDGRRFDLRSRPGAEGARADQAPDLVLRLPAWVVMDVRVGAMTLEEALDAGLASKQGTARALRHFQQVFRFGLGEAAARR